jgi:hypothetical protein
VQRSHKFYVFDLVPEKSIVQLALKGGLQTFVIGWKNPSPAESHFGLDTYVAAREAVGVMRDITGSRRQHLGLVLRRYRHVGLPREPCGAWRSQGSQHDRGGLHARMAVTQNSPREISPAGDA